MEHGPGEAPEAVAEALSLRYGSGAGELDAGVLSGVWNGILDRQLAHRSVRRFLPGDVSPAQVQAMVAAAQSSATSSNLQAWSVVTVRDPERKARLAELSGRQGFMARAPLVLVFIADFARDESIIGRSAATDEALSYVESTLVAFIDAALAASNAALAAESMGLGICYIGSVRNNPAEVCALLELPPHAFPVFGMTVGIPDPDERGGVRPRLPQSVVVHDETYRPGQDMAGAAGYEGDLAGYFARFGRDHSWRERLAERLDGVAGLHGREILHDVLEAQAFPSR